MENGDGDPVGVSRRFLFGASAAGVVPMLGLAGGNAGGAPPRVAVDSPANLARPQALLGAGKLGLTYVQLDGTAFFPGFLGDGRVYQEITGVQPNLSARSILAPLALPVGSVVRQINVAYVNSPIITIRRRSMTAPNPPTQEFQQTTEIGTNPNTITFDLATPVTITADALYYLDVFCSAGDSIFGMTIGYTPPTQSFVPFAGSLPRVLDTREGTGLKLQPGQELIVDMGFIGARSAVFNLTVTETVGAGFVACFPAGLAWPGNSSINWSGPNQNVANGVICALDGNSRLVLRGGVNPTHVIVDRIGFML
jgi:hypothetical protein